MKGFLQHSLCTLFLKQQPDEAPTIAQTNSDPPEGVPERATGRRGVWGESRLPGCPLLPHGLTIPSSLQTEVSFGTRLDGASPLVTARYDLHGRVFVNRKEVVS